MPRPYRRRVPVPAPAPKPAEGLGPVVQTMKPCWRERGLTELGARQADLALDDMMMILQRVSADGARAALEEAIFRTLHLPMRTASFKDRYLKENGSPVSPEESR